MDTIPLSCPHCRTKAQTVCENCHQPNCEPCTARHALKPGECANCLRTCYCFAESSTGFRCARYRVRRAQQRIRLRKTMTDIPTVRFQPAPHCCGFQPRHTPPCLCSRWRTALASTHFTSGWRRPRRSYDKRVRPHRPRRHTFATALLPRLWMLPRLQGQQVFSPAMPVCSSCPTSPLSDTRVP